MDGVFTQKYRISACDVDFSDKWKIQSLLASAQETANDQCCELGEGRDALKDKCGAAFILARTYLEMYSYPKSSEKVYVTTWPKDGMKHILTRYFKIEDENGQTVASIVSHWAVLDLKERKLVSPVSCGIQMPDTSGVPDLLAMPARRICGYEDAERKVLTAQYSDIDTLGHVNNTKYVQWVMDFLGVDFLKKHTVCSLDIRYSHEVVAGQEIVLEKYFKNDEGIVFIRGLSEKNGVTCFETVLRVKSSD